MRALHRGWSAPALRHALERLATRPLLPDEFRLLKAWADAADKITIRHTILLETTDPEVITRLASTRRGRQLITRTHSPRTVEVDPTQLDRLTQRLIAQEGIPPKRETTTADPLPLDDSHSATAHLLTAIRVYQQLGDHLPLPVRIPQAVLDTLIASATPQDLATARLAAERTLDQLQPLLDGRAPFPPWIDTELPLTDIHQLITEALATGTFLDIDYYAASTDRLTHRLVEPYRLEGQSEDATPLLPHRLLPPGPVRAHLPSRSNTGHKE